MEFEIISPKTKSDLLDTIRENDHFRFGAGCTDLLMELKKNPVENLTVINLSGIKDAGLTGIKIFANKFRIGALVTAHNIVVNEHLKSHFPVLHQAAHTLASTQIRQVATIGGNLCTASPSGDIACALVSLEAQCEIMSASGKTRIVPITDFFTGPRKTVIKAKEFLYGISVPANEKNSNRLLSGFIKIGTRRSMECSVVSLAYHIQIDENNKIIKAGVAIGASAPVIRFTKTACEYVTGKKLNKIPQKVREEFAGKVLSYASPITDIRASAWYRKEVLFNISKSIFE